MPNLYKIHFSLKYDMSLNLEVYIAGEQTRKMTPVKPRQIHVVKYIVFFILHLCGRFRENLIYSKIDRYQTSLSQIYFSSVKIKQKKF